ncbi:MAG: DUF4300 family protein [Anaerovoracaceae bacterium]
MKKQLKRTIILTGVLVLTIALSACGAKSAKDLMKSDLTAKEDQALLEKILENAGITDTKEYFDNLNKFNELQGDENNQEVGLNCRVSEFLLMKDFVEAKEQKGYGNYLMFDIDAIDNDKRCQSLKAQKSDFIALFNEISVKGMSDKEMEEAYPKAWADRGIKYLNDKVSIINVVLNDPYDHINFVGHTGMLMEYEGYYWFLEKISPEDPYQLTRYNNKKDLKNELENRPRYQDEAAHKPMVYENGKIL